MFTDKTFYTGDIFIPNLEEKCNNLYFFEWIEQWEEQCLRLTLGDFIYNELVSQMEFNEDMQKYVLKDSADEKWNWLVNGHTYTRDDSTNQFIDFSASSSSLSVLPKTTVTATANQTEITVSNSPVGVYLYLNGQWQIEGLDFTYQDGLIALLNTVEDNDLFEIIPLISTANGNTPQGTSIVRWDGIVKSIDRRIPETTIKGETANGIVISKSYLAYFIYWMWALNEDTFTSGTGEKIANTKGGESISNTHKRVNAYNKFVSMVTDCNHHGRVGLYMFMKDFSDLFPQWQGEPMYYESIW